MGASMVTYTPIQAVLLIYLALSLEGDVERLRQLALDVSVSGDDAAAQHLIERVADLLADAVGVGG